MWEAGVKIQAIAAAVDVALMFGVGWAGNGRRLG